MKNWSTVIKNMNSLVKKSKLVFNIYFYKITKRRLFPPYAVSWFITWRCNSKCLYCNLGKGLEDKNFYKELKKSELTFFEVKRVIDELFLNGVEYVAFSGGEPYMREDFFEIVKEIKKYGLVVSVTTNGLLLNDELARETVNSKIDVVGISLDVPDENYDLIRNIPNAFAKVDRGIDKLIKARFEARSKKPIIDISAVVSKYNYNKLHDLVRYAIEKQVDGIAFQPCIRPQIRCGNKWEDFSLFLKEEIMALRNNLLFLFKKYPKLLKNSKFFTKLIVTYFENPLSCGIRCFAGISNLCIFPNGDVGICPWLPAAGNLKEQTIKEIIYSKKFNELLKTVRLAKCHGCLCPIYHEPNLLFHPIDLISSITTIRRKLMS